MSKRSDRHFFALLEVKMGGKNMTLSQRLFGTRIGRVQVGRNDARNQENSP